MVWPPTVSVPDLEMVGFTPILIPIWPLPDRESDPSNLIHFALLFIE